MAYSYNGPHMRPLHARPMQFGQLLHSLWPDLLSEEDFSDGNYSSLFDYVEWECQMIRNYPWHFPGDELTTAAFIIDRVQHQRNTSRFELHQDLQKCFPDVDSIDIIRVFEMSMRLWMTVNFRSSKFPPGAFRADTTVAQWQDDATVEDFIGGVFPKNGYAPTSCNLIQPGFSAAKLIEICGIKIHWSSNLLDHLQFNRKTRTITVYKHKVLLNNHMNSLERSPFPHRFLSETIDTLNLLFPFADTDTKTLLLHEDQPFWTLGTCKRKRELDLSQYQYWYPRLSVLIHTFEEPPHNWWQLLADRRNKQEYATFVVAVLAFILALLSLVMGGISAVYAIKQYKLGKAQACSSWNGDLYLAAYCS